MSGLIDYAGLFPPAELPMRSAVEQFAEYLAGPDSSYLGRFVVPGARLDEFKTAAAGILRNRKGKGARPWRLSALGSGEPRHDTEKIREFNSSRWDELTDHPLIDVLEMKTKSPADVATAGASIPKSLTAYFEIPIDGNLERSIAEVKRVGCRAKIRTGGVTADAFPSAPQIVRFMRACESAGVPFKATAGLHHPVRSAYRLTYKPDSDRGMMFGFLNVFLAAAFLRAGASDETVLAVLEETDGTAFQFDDGGVSWRAHRLTTDELRETRETFAVSFGSCSFTEPVKELKQLTAQAAAV